ncbi:AAA family ATPase [Ornithinimicrobium avium]|uniref:AAA family ATPase n=1 Tax=Ornithinimicrobium avium TaxID=2283195 RepID=UPI00192D6208|nr:hypothetical protein [Ornithinimicrobium avium]
MTRILLTGMSGVGKTTVLAGLRERGWRTVDADEDGLVDEHPDRTDLRLPELVAILTQPRHDRPLAVAATGEGQGRLYPLVDHVVALVAPWPVLRERLATRTTNHFGKDPCERERVRADLESYEPLLRSSADVVLDTSTHCLDAVLDRLDSLIPAPSGTGGRR